MAVGKANCALCGKPIMYFETALPVRCEICGKEETGHCTCEDGHYVCDTCHRSIGVDFIREICRSSDSENPIELAQQIMDDQSIYPNGPEHHSLVGAVLLCAYKNAGGNIDLEKALEELRNRSLQVPGGTCGYWGCCGAAISAGQFYSIISSTTPLTHEAWAATAGLTARAIDRLARIGGPRCCKRTSFAVIEETVDYVSETMGIQMQLPEHITCHYMGSNAECLKTACPFYPPQELG